MASSTPTNCSACSLVSNYVVNDVKFTDRSGATDMSLSKDLTQQFKERQEAGLDSEDITFTVMVLGTNFWPLSAPTHAFNIPEDLTKTYNRFQLYYQSKHS